MSFLIKIKGARYALITIFGVLIIDQLIKLYVKTHFYLGEEYAVAGDWFIIHFTENPGMAFGMQFGGNFGKLLLTVFRIIAAVLGVFYIRNLIRNKMHRGLVVSVSLIFAGAVGNIIDSMFYGLLFDKGTVIDAQTAQNMGYMGMAELNGSGYSSFLHGSVVDMFYFPLVEGVYPSWVPFVGGDYFQFFRPVFNFADASISVGVMLILLFQKRFFKKDNLNETSPANNDDSKVDLENNS